MRSIGPTSQAFKHDQRTFYTVEYWDTPFTPLTIGQTPDIASNGIILNVREPVHSTDADIDGTFTVAAAVDAASITSTAARTAFMSASNGSGVVTDGRVANLVNYWAGGAPGAWGASVNRRIAMHFQMQFRSIPARAWFTSSNPAAVFFAIGGFGYVRMVKNLGTGGAQDLWKGKVTEKDFLQFGLPLVNTTLQTGDTIDIFYVQDGEEWGGYVFKCGLQSGLTGQIQKQLAAGEAPVIGSGLFDDGSVVPHAVLDAVNDCRVVVRPGQAAVASFTAPLFNTQVNDGIGWEWVRHDLLSTGAGEDLTGFLRYWSNGDGVTHIDVRRQRLVRISMGYITPTGTRESWPVFTGFVDDFTDAGSGRVAVQCLGFEQRLADQSIKNYPDRISYQTAALNKLTAQGDPVYNIGAYDAWYIEYCVRDMLLRCGIDESRFVAPLRVPQADGTDVPVVM